MGFCVLLQHSVKSLLIFVVVVAVIYAFRLIHIDIYIQILIIYLRQYIFEIFTNSYFVNILF